MNTCSEVAYCADCRKFTRVRLLDLPGRSKVLLCPACLVARMREDWEMVRTCYPTWLPYGDPRSHRPRA